jgi:hypothetical protein
MAILRNSRLLVVELPRINGCSSPGCVDISMFSLRPPHTSPTADHSAGFPPEIKSLLSPCNQPASVTQSSPFALIPGPRVNNKIIIALVSKARRLDFPGATWRSANAGSFQENSRTQDSGAALHQEQPCIWDSRLSESEGLDLAHRTQSRHVATAEPQGATRRERKAAP